jgi:hypothetical protein
MMTAGNKHRHLPSAEKIFLPIGLFEGTVDFSSVMLQFSIENSGQK